MADFIGDVAKGSRNFGSFVFPEETSHYDLFNYLFVNFNSSAVDASGFSNSVDYPSANTTIVGTTASARTRSIRANSSSCAITGSSS
ncbi:MAG: hypothetical protein HGA44_09930 [Cellulomonadaceae bacterium]|nr:hypothetical protein [Cellulomonadaceae bacterium]